MGLAMMPHDVLRARSLLRDVAHVMLGVPVSLCWGWVRSLTPILPSLDSSSQYCVVLWVLCLFGGCAGGCSLSLSCVWWGVREVACFLVLFSHLLSACLLAYLLSLALVW